MTIIDVVVFSVLFLLGFFSLPLLLLRVGRA